MTNPINPNFKPGVGRLATDRYDFQSHVDGSAFNHLAGQIVVSPALTIGLQTVTDVQTALALLSGSIIIPSVPDATVTTKGIIRLNGDLAGLSSTALNPQIGSLQGSPLSITNPVMPNQVLQYVGGTWQNQTLVTATTSTTGTIQLSVGASPSTTGDLGGSFNNTKVLALQGFPILNTVPSSGNVLIFSGGSWGPGTGADTPQATVSIQGTVQLAGDFNGAGGNAVTPRTSGINGATVPAAGVLTTSQVLQVSGSAALSYGFIADANVAIAAAIQGSKITPSFGSQNLSTTGTAALGATTITGALVAGASTAVNTLTGSSTVTTRIVTVSFAVDTATTDYIIFCRTLSGAISITLPTPTNGRMLIIKDSEGNAASNNITLIPHSTDKIEGLNVNKVLANSWGSWTLVSNGTDWFLA